MNGWVTAPQEIVRALKPALKSSNFHVSFAALAVVQPFVNFVDAEDLAAVHDCIASFTPPVLDRSGDARERVRDAAAKDLEALGKLALAATASSGAGRGGESTPITSFEEIMRGSGLQAKSAKVREQVSTLF